MAILCWAAKNSTRGDFNARQGSIARLYFCQTPMFCIYANILRGRLYFVYPPIFLGDANIFEGRQYFLRGANILYTRQYFRETPIF